MEATIIVVIALAFPLFYLGVRFYDYTLKKRLHEHVAWCVSNDSLLYRCGLTLFDYIWNAQVKHDLSKEYRLIADSERTTAKEILKYFQEYLNQAYFKGDLSFSRENVNMASETYFIVLLKYYLEKHECETYFHENKMYTTKSYKSFGRWGGELFEATYELTDYAVVYHKILYTVRLCYLDIFKEKIQEHSVAHRSAEYSKKVLDSKEIEVSRV